MNTDEAATITIQPKSAADQARWKVQRSRRRVLTGHWGEDLREAMAEALHIKRLEVIGEPTTAMNVAQNVTDQVAITHDQAPLVRLSEEFGDDEDLADMLEILEEAQVWALMQSHDRFVVGLRESLLLLGWSEARGAVTLTLVTPDTVEVRANADDYRVIEEVRRARWRVDPETGTRRQYWDVYLLDPAGVGSLSVVDADGNDVTSKFLAGEPWPFKDSEGADYLPWILSHAQPTGRVWDYTKLSELYSVTFDVAAAWTMFHHVLRNASWAQKYGLGVRLAGGSPAGGTGPSNRQEVVTDPSSVLLFELAGDLGGTLGVLAPPVDPSVFAKSILDYQRVALSNLGISPGDLQQRTGAESGYAISLKRSAQRSWAKRHEAAMRDTDRQLLTLLAKVSNTFGETALPEDGWSVLYQYADDPVAERMEQFEYDRGLVENGLLSRVDWLRSLRPGMNEDQAMQSLVESAAVERALSPAGLREILLGGSEPDMVDGLEAGERLLVEETETETETETEVENGE